MYTILSPFEMKMREYFSEKFVERVVILHNYPKGRILHNCPKGRILHDCPKGRILHDCPKGR